MYVLNTELQMKNLTANEATALKAIAARARKEGAKEVAGWAVDSSKYNPFPNKRTLAGVHASLSTKGLVEVSFLENGRGGKHIEQVSLTEAGVEAIAECVH
jgi:hypothetical protein